MKDLINFSGNTLAVFENNIENIREFGSLLKDASHRVYNKYSEADTQNIIRNTFDQVMGINFAESSPMTRRQAWRRHGVEIAELIEDVVLDKMVSGWNSNNAKFAQFVEDINIADGQKNEFFVEDTSLLQVSVFAGNHHDIVRQALKPGKSFSIDTSYHTIKCYTDFELMRLGKIDFATMVDRMYKSIENERWNSLYEAFMSMDSSLPTDMILETPVSETTKDAIIEQAELVRSVTGMDVMFVGSRVAIQKLQNTVSYNMYSDNMRDEQNQKGILANWEGYDCLPLERVNKTGTRTNLLDNTKIFIVPIDPDFKPIKRVFEGEVVYTESGTNGEKKDMTVDAELTYKEGVGVVINQLFGLIKIQTA